MRISTEMPAPRVDLLEGIDRMGIVDADYEPRVRELTPDERTERERELDIEYEAHQLPPFSEYVERMNNALREGGGVGFNVNPPTRGGPDASYERSRGYSPRISRLYHPSRTVEEVEQESHQRRVQLHDEVERLRRFLDEND